MGQVNDMDIYPVSDGRGVHTVVMELNWRQAAYVLACLGAANGRLFSDQADLVGEAGPSELYAELRDALGVQSPQDPEADGYLAQESNQVTRLFKRYSAVLDAWCGRRNYNAAKRVAEEVGL